MDLINWVILVLIVLAIALAVWRFLTLRPRGASVVMRRLPASGTHGWRHGTVRYDNGNLEYYKLRSLSPRADLVISRGDLVFHRTRPMSDREASFMASGLIVAVISDAVTEYELAMDQRGLMALTAWVESAPDARQERVDIKRLRERITRGRNGR